MTTDSKVLAIIPARLGSTRLERKPLKMISGKSLIQRVWEQASSCELVSKTLVATDSQEIVDHVSSFGGEAVLTSEAIPTGTERVYAASKVCGGQWDCIVNVQGDMPFLPGRAIEAAVSQILSSDVGFDMTTVATPLISEQEFISPSNVKVVFKPNCEAIYFSRAPIPHSRDGKRLEFGGEEVFGFKHMGLYVFTPKALERFSTLTSSALESVEMLEQLRALEDGLKIGLAVLESRDLPPSVEVDTPDDLARAEEIAGRIDKK